MTKHLPADSNGQHESSRLRAFVYYERLRRLKDYVEENYSGRITAKDAAQVCSLEEKYFSSYFRKSVGVRFGEWLAKYRVTQAREMMEVSDYSITHIAFAVGFNDLRTFERAFKRFVGTTPRSFQNAIRRAVSTGALPAQSTSGSALLDSGAQRPG